MNLTEIREDLSKFQETVFMVVSNTDKLKHNPVPLLDTVSNVQWMVWDSVREKW